jgi:hypothetical protein
MGQLTNLYVSQSYQGLLKLADSTSGVTGTLQAVQDGVGNNLPIKISNTQVTITGSFYGDGSGLTGLTVNTGSLVSTSSFNAYTSSNDSKVNSLIAATGSYASQTGVTALSSSIATTDLNQNNRLSSIETVTGSLQNQINQKLDTGSFNTYTSSNDSKVNSLIASTGSYATTSSLTALSQSIASTDLAQNNRLGSLEAATSSYITNSQTSSMSVASASFASFAVSSSQAANAVSASQAQNAVSASQSQNSVSSSFASNATSASYSNNSTSASYAQFALSASYAPDISNRNGLITTGSVGGSQSITGSLGISGTLTATSASITYLETVYETASIIYSSGSNQFGDASNDTQTLWGTVNLPSGALLVTGSVYLTDIKGTGSLFLQPNQADARFVEIYNTSPTDTHITASGGQIFLGDDQTYVKVDNYGSVERIDIVAGNELNVSSSVINVTGSLNAPSITGSLQGTASYATNALSSSHAINADTASYVLNAVSSSYSDFAVSSSQAQNAVSASQSQNSVSASQAANAVSASQADNAVSASWANNFSRTGLITTGSAASSQSITGSLTLSGSAGVELDVKGDVLITGSVILSGSVGIELDVKGDTTITGSLGIRSGSLSTFSQGTTVNTNLYLTSSDLGHSNIIQGWGDNLAAGGAGATQANYTGSLRITGSNNIVSMPQIRATGIGGGVDSQGYISGSGNMIMGNNAGIYLNTGSLLFPKTQNNILSNGSAIHMNFTTSSLSGGHPIVGNNIAMGATVNIASNSGSIQSLSTNALLGGGITSTQNFLTNTRPTINANNVIGAITLNHISSSISYQNNYNNSPLTINNHLSSSNITNNSVSIANNAFLGGSSSTGVSMWISGSQSSNATRNVIDNIIGGKNIIISSSFVSSSNSSLVASLIYGQNLTVSGSNSTTVGGSAFLGRYNGLSGLEYSQDVVLAVGTGTGTSNRRTGLWITSGSVTNVSGSMNVIGQTIMSSSTSFPLYVSGTMQTQRLHFEGNPFNADVSSNLAALRIASNNTVFNISMYDNADITTSSYVMQTVDTGSALVSTELQANNRGQSYKLTLNNQSGTGSLSTNANVIITGSLGISSLSTSTGSFVVTTDSTGTLTKAPYSGITSNLFNAAQYSTLQTLSGSANVSQSIYFDTTGVQFGVSLVDNTKLTVANPGTYNIQFSAQLEADGGADNVFIWFKKNGTNIAGSASEVELDNNKENIMTVNILDTAVANDYYEIAWQNANNHGRLLYQAASGNVPSTPSVIATITQVR